MLIEILILLAILAEIGWSIYVRKQDAEALTLLKEIKTILEDSNAELADIRDETVDDETIDEHISR
jgi:hypothetical protein